MTVNANLCCIIIVPQCAHSQARNATLGAAAAQDADNVFITPTISVIIGFFFKNVSQYHLRNSQNNIILELHPNCSSEGHLLPMDLDPFMHREFPISFCSTHNVFLSPDHSLFCHCGALHSYVYFTLTYHIPINLVSKAS